MNLTTRYGDVKISSVADSFESIVFNGAYTGLKAGISDKVSYKIDAMVSYGNIKYDAAKAKVNKIEQNTSIELNGIIGSSESTNSQVYVRSKYGSVNLMKTGSNDDE